MTWHNGEDIHYWPKTPKNGQTETEMLIDEITFLYGELTAMHRRVKTLERRNVFASMLSAVRRAVQRERYRQTPGVR